MDLVLRLDQNAEKGREGVQNPENFADVICTCPPSAYLFTILPRSAKREVRGWVKFVPAVALSAWPFLGSA